MTTEAQKLSLIQQILALQDYQILEKIEHLLKSNRAQTNISVKSENAPSKKKRKAGFAKSIIVYVAPDFDETPPGFEEYMQQNQ